MRKENIGYLQLITASILMGFIPLLVRWGNNIGPYNLTFFKVLLIALSIGVPAIFYSKIKIVPLKYEIPKMILFGGLHGFIFLGYFYALTYLPVASAVLLLYTGPIWMIVFSHFILKEKIKLTFLVSFLTAFVGVFLVLSPVKIIDINYITGSLAALLGGVGFGLVYVLSKTFKKYDPVSLTFWQNIIAIPFVLPLLLIDIPKFNFQDIGIILLVSIVCGTLPFILIFKGLRKVSGQTASAIVLLDIIFPILLAAIILKEIPQISAMIGGCLIIIGAYLSTRSG